MNLVAHQVGCYPSFCSVKVSIISLSTRTVIGHFCRPYSTVPPAKFKLEWLPFPHTQFQEKEIQYLISY